MMRGILHHICSGWAPSYGMMMDRWLETSSRTDRNVHPLTSSFSSAQKVRHLFHHCVTYTIMFRKKNSHLEAPDSVAIVTLIPTHHCPITSQTAFQGLNSLSEHPVLSITAPFHMDKDSIEMNVSPADNEDGHPGRKAASHLSYFCFAHPPFQRPESGKGIPPYCCITTPQKPTCLLLINDTKHLLLWPFRAHNLVLPWLSHSM